MINPIRGFYDEPKTKNNEYIRAFLRSIFPDRESRRTWREYCVKNGYGSKETMLEILPDEGLNL